MVRRILLILVTGLIVARPFIRGEDPALEAPIENLDTSSLLLTMLWFVAAALWAVWRLWARQGTWYGGLLEGCLFAVVLLMFGGAAFVAPYKHAAWLMAWEWLAMAIGFFLLRQLAISREEQHCFFAVMMAGLLVLSVYAIYQRGYEIPKNQQHYAKDPEQFRRDWADQTGERITDDDELALRQERVMMPYAFATFANPNSFAGYLALLIPGGVGGAILCARHKQPRWQVVLAASFATLGVVALFTTSSRGAILATLVTTLGVVALIWRDWLRSHWYYALGVVLLLALLGVGVWKSDLWTSGLGKKESTAGYRLDYWRGASRMIGAQPWFGVGPGQFGRYYTRYMDPTAGETIMEPHNFALEIWATCGLFALLALLAVFALFYWKVFRALLDAPTVDGPDDVPPVETLPDGQLPLRWEFYVGGMFGMLLAFFLRVVDLSKDEIVIESVMAGFASVLWFGSFALFEQIRWSPRARLLVLSAGVTATLLNLLVSGGINYPCVAFPLWVAAALALNCADLTPNRWGNQVKPLLYVPLPLFAAVAALYFVTEFYPITTTVHRMQRTAAEIKRWRDRSQQMVGGAILSFDFSPATTIAPLDKAMREEDPGNERIPLFLADLEYQRWRNNRRGLRVTSMSESTTRIEDQAVAYARRAEDLDPIGREPFLKEYNLHREFAWGRELSLRLPAQGGLSARMMQIQSVGSSKYEEYCEKRNEEYQLAAEALEKLLKNDPYNASLHYQLADCYLQAHEPAKARPIAEKALELPTKWPTRRLTKEQTLQLKEFLGRPTAD